MFSSLITYKVVYTYYPCTRLGVSCIHSEAGAAQSRSNASAACDFVARLSPRRPSVHDLASVLTGKSAWNDQSSPANASVTLPTHIRIITTHSTTPSLCSRRSAEAHHFVFSSLPKFTQCLRQREDTTVTDTRGASARCYRCSRWPRTGAARHQQLVRKDGSSATRARRCVHGESRSYIQASRPGAE